MRKVTKRQINQIVDKYFGVIDKRALTKGEKGTLECAMSMAEDLLSQIPTKRELNLKINSIIEELFIGGQEVGAKRLVMEQSFKLDGPGWCKGAIIDILQKHLIK